MKRVIDIDAILVPIPGDNPAGEDLRYTSVYEEIKEARREDADLVMGDWKRDIKKADWDKSIKLAVEALTKRTKDLQLAAWLTEALSKTEGLEGLAAGLKIFNGFLRDYWESAYPEIEEGDLEFRIGPIEFMNDKLSFCLKEALLTDRGLTPGYSLLEWEESRRVGYEKDAPDGPKRSARDELIQEGKLPPEDFDAAVARSSRAFYESLWQHFAMCRDEFNILDQTAGEKFGASGPRLAEFRTSIDSLDQFLRIALKEKRQLEPDPEPAPSTPEEETVLSADAISMPEGGAAESPIRSGVALSGALPVFVPGEFSDSAAFEKTLWEQAVQTLKTAGIKGALGQLLAASYAASSVRERNRYRLLMVRLCLKAGRPDLARPIAEELHSLIEELHLGQWESPIWIAEVLDVLYQCLTTSEASEEDMERAKVLFQRLCLTDVTKAIG